MLDLGLPEILVLSVLALLLFGPSRLPDMARSLGRGIREFQRSMREEAEGQGGDRFGRSDGSGSSGHSDRSGPGEERRS